MKKNNNYSRYNNYYLWENVKNKPYNYEKDGLIQHIMSRVIINSNNELLKNILNTVESSLIFMMKYIDKLKNFKNYHIYNR